MQPTTFSRRAFLRSAGLTGLAAFIAPAQLGAMRVGSPPPAAPPVRVRGRVLAGGRGVARAAVTDGRAVVLTDAEGMFELVSDSTRRWVSLSLPAGHEVPVSPTGTALLHRPVAPGAGGEMDTLFVIEPRPDGDERHAFLLLADPQTQNAFEMARLHDETIPDLQATVAELGGLPIFGVACGDIMYDDLTLYPEYERAIHSTGVPFFQVVGNHDLDKDGWTDEASTSTFQRYFGPGHYSFNRGAVHYVVLDDVFFHGAGYLGYLTDEQLTWLAADLEYVDPGVPVIVLLHIPLLSTQHLRYDETQPRPSISVANREALYRLLEPFEAHVLSGHTHECEHVQQGRVSEHVHGAVCGAWWSGEIGHDGAPNGYGVYEVDGSSIRWYYKSTGGPVDHQMRIYPAGADPAAPAELVANVWNWDPGWTVVWYDGADTRGEMTRRRGLDPLAVEQQTGPDLPPRRGWVEPMPTEHLFYAPAPTTGTTVTVEATDPFGRTYTARLEPTNAR